MATFTCRAILHFSRCRSQEHLGEAKAFPTVRVCTLPCRWEAPASTYLALSRLASAPPPALVRIAPLEDQRAHFFHLQEFSVFVSCLSIYVYMNIVWMPALPRMPGQVWKELISFWPGILHLGIVWNAYLLLSKYAMSTTQISCSTQSTATGQGFGNYVCKTIRNVGEKCSMSAFPTRGTGRQPLRGGAQK